MKTSIKEIFRKEHGCLADKEYPSILTNMGEMPLSVIKFVVDKHNEGKEEIKSGEISKYMREHYSISKDYFQKIRQQLVKDKILVCGEKTGYYFVHYEIRDVYNFIFNEQLKIKIFNLEPERYHHIASFIIRIPKENFIEKNLIIFIRDLQEERFQLLGKGVEYLDESKEKIKNIIFYYEPLLYLYFLIVALQYFNEDNKYFYYVLKSDIHITAEHKDFYGIVKTFSARGNENKLFKKWAESICFTYNFNIFGQYLFPLFGAQLTSALESAKFFANKAQKPVRVYTVHNGKKYEYEVIKPG